MIISAVNRCFQDNRAIIVDIPRSLARVENGIVVSSIAALFVPDACHDVMIVMGGEFGRTPRIGDQTPDGRGHWPDAGFLWVGGGGLRTGQIIGATDSRGEKVVGSPINMKALIATIYRQMGIDPASTLLDHNGRPQYLLDERDPLAALI
ncbi:MAG: hypothetical protein JWN70_889 [Planctomycetaceae bacterium]|nr:hypothetical protein [Planctomycetaceae bacterium]